MKKLILIDGNSLLNRAYYAMSVFTTKEGMPTNGIFGFIKLLLKVIDDEQPEYLAVAFDVHAPTFRHKMYDGYKGTRKPMPEDLVVQLPVLKDLLHAMNVCTVELAGYEADDVIGSLTRKFDDVHFLVYTGDRDSYQLVKENVDICFTKRGVSDLERLTSENFFEKVGLKPWQIIEEKSLMGDSSDNIPGVKGIGPKSAMELLQKYQSLDGVYSHLDDLKPSMRKKLEESRELAYLSRTLATIDLKVPLSVSLEECALSLPFSEEAREFFNKLEFRSLVNATCFATAKTISSKSVIECTDLSALIKSADETNVFAICIEPEGVYLSVCGQDYLLRLKENFLSTGFFPEELKPLFDVLFSKDKCAVVSDYKALAHFLDHIDMAANCKIEDLSLLSYLIDSNQRQTNAKELAQDRSLPKENCATALLLAYEETARRAANTTEEKLYRELELPLSQVLFQMEKTGVRVDLAKFPEFSEKFTEEISRLSEKIFSYNDNKPFNINSPFQLSELLFEKLKLNAKGIKKNSRGGYSTNADVLEKLAEDHEIVRFILRYRELQKLQSTYIDGIRPLAVSGIVHTTYNQTMTTTGRLSSSNPNLQNIPVRTEEGKELRKLFIPREGNILIDADYSQIELRLLAHFSGCKALIEAYQSGEDVHAATAARVFGVKLADVTSAMRRRAKTINFGIIYGMSAFGLSKDLNCAASEAQEYITKYFQLHPEVKAYMDSNVEKAKADGYVTTILGRKRYIPEIKASNFNTRSFGERAAMNMPLQGSAADIIKIAMLRVDERLKEDGLRSKLVLQVHDELVLDTPLQEQELAEKMLKDEMEGAVALSVPLVAEVSVGKSWYDAK